MTLLMSFCTKAVVAAKKQVVPPKMATNANAPGAYSNRGEDRAIINTPAVTIVAACISAETGVGPSMASGNQVCNPNCADFPTHPINRRTQTVVNPSNSRLQNRKVLLAKKGAQANAEAKVTVWH